MKIAFFVPNSNISNVDFSQIEDGNPGVGGSEYSAILIASCLCKRGNIDTVVLVEKQAKFPKYLKWHACGCLVRGINYTQQNKIDYLIVDGKLLTKEIVCKFYKVKFVAWANTFVSPNMYDFYAKRKNLVSIVNVGKEQLEQTNGTPIYEKSCYIYNAVPTVARDSFSDMIINGKREHNVCYIGSLHPAKGFQYLAKAWPKVKAQVSDAQLFVIGSGRLYGRDAKLGTWGLASKEFEEEFMCHLVENGNIIDSVHFLGILGKEKYDILSKCKVGVPNPSGVSETFGYTAVEMQFMDCQVTTIKCAGYLDTVCEKTNLYNNTDELADYIVRLLNKSNYDNKSTLEYIKRFSIENVVNQWEQFIHELEGMLKKEFYAERDITYYKNVLRFYIWQFKVKIKVYIKKIIKR